MQAAAALWHRPHMPLARPWQPAVDGRQSQHAAGPVDGGLGGLLGCSWGMWQPKSRTSIRARVPSRSPSALQAAAHQASCTGVNLPTARACFSAVAPGRAPGLRIEISRQRSRGQPGAAGGPSLLAFEPTTKVGPVRYDGFTRGDGHLHGLANGVDAMATRLSDVHSRFEEAKESARAALGGDEFAHRYWETGGKRLSDIGEVLIMLTQAVGAQEPNLRTAAANYRASDEASTMH